MATQQTRKPRGAELTAEQEAQVEAIRPGTAPLRPAPRRPGCERRSSANTAKPAPSRSLATGRRWATWCRFVASSCRCAASGNAWGSPWPTWPSARDRQGGPEPPRERPAAQPHGEYPGPVRARPRQVPRLGNGRGGRPLKLEPVSPIVAPAPRPAAGRPSAGPTDDPVGPGRLWPAREKCPVESQVLLAVMTARSQDCLGTEGAVERPFGWRPRHRHAFPVERLGERLGTPWPRTLDWGRYGA